MNGRPQQDDVSATGDGRAKVVSVNVGRPRTVDWRGRQVTSAIWKEPVEDPVTIEWVNLVGDDQADRRVHGGPDKAVYAYSVEDYRWWSTALGSLAPGTFGENLTTLGFDLSACYIGDRWHLGSAILEVSQPRQPCFKLGIRMGDDHFPGKFAAAGRPGVYLRIALAGIVTSGDAIEIVPAEQPAIRISSLSEDNIPQDVLRQAIQDTRVPLGWRRAAARALGPD